MKCFRYSVLCIASTLVLAVLTYSADAIVISDTLGSHDVAPGQPRYGLNLDGVALLGWDVPDSSSIDDVIRQCSGALIADRHVLTAAHCFDEDNDGNVDSLVSGFPFLAAFELADGPVFLPIDTSAVHFPPGWPEEDADLAIAKLTTDAPPQIPRYPLFGGNDERGQQIVVAGYGDTGHASTGADPTIDADANIKRAGLNQYDEVRDDLGTEFLAADFDNGKEAQNSLAVIGFTSDLGLGREESMQANGDSGAPSFIDGKIAGVTAFGARVLAADVTGATDSSWGELQFDTRVSAFQDFITTATGGAAAFVTTAPLSGDYNASGTVEQADLDLVLLNWGEDGSVPPSGWTNDLPHGQIDQEELDDVLLNWGNTSAAGATTVAVPEPGTLTLLTMGLVGVALASRQAAKRRHWASRAA